MIRFLSLVFVVTLLPIAVCAGSSQATNPVLPAAEVARFSDQVQRDLAARGAQVAIVARMGRDPASLPDGVNYTHLGFWVYAQITHADGTTGRGYRVYNLYQRAGDRTASDLIQDSPADFFAGAKRLDAGIIIPDARLQSKLLQVINSPAYAALHNPRYAVLANPADGTYQNCTEHTLKVVMAALYGTADSARLHANIAAHFEGQTIPLDGLQRALGPAFSAALTTQDHGAVVKTATFGSLVRFMKAHRLSQVVYRISRDGVQAL